jgi:transposase
MLCDPSPPRLSEFDLQVYSAVVRRDHYLRKALEVVPWDSFHEILAPYYCPDRGRPPEPPVLMLKLEYLRYHHNLSDRDVINRAQTDMAFRFFLQIPIQWALPNFTSLCVFRGRLGVKGFRRVFNQVVHLARERGVVKDRLRLKDATHVIANIAVPTALALVAQTRDKLLAAAEPFASLMVEGERVSLEMLRETTKGLKPEDHLATRVAHLREMLAWADEVTPPDGAEKNRLWQTFLAQRDLAHKILYDQEHPEAGDRTRSTTDPEARRARHGQWYDGYMMDVSMDADSEMITQINVLAANGDEAADAAELIRQEEAAQGNDVEAVSIDGAGFNGPALRELEDPKGLAVNVFTPPSEEKESTIFTPEDFVKDEQRKTVTCPAGQTSRYRRRDQHDHGWVYQFTRQTCDDCPLLSQCMTHPPKGKFGKAVRKNDYDAEYRRARQKATTPEYTAVRREHPKVERKLGEVMNRHGGRRACYRGQRKVLIQELMACTAANVKRLVRLVCAPEAAISYQF